MSVVTMVLVLLLAVVVCGLAARLLPLPVPLPLLQIAAGAALSWSGFYVELDPQVFLLLFIPPLLFLDGWRIPKGAFFREWKVIVALAVGLVVFSVAGLGFFIHWLMPAVPLAVAFALAAILSPTDPVAVQAMTRGSPLPSRMMNVLEGEALLNDATGLVCFSFAVNAALSGGFSLGGASLSFLTVAGGGLLVGIATVALVGKLNLLLVRRTGEEPAIQILISLLIPFAAYMVGEHLQVSGILAAAVAGISMHYFELAGLSLAATRVQRDVVWNMAQTVLAGIIFVMLGQQLPRLLRSLPGVLADSNSADAWQLLGWVLLVTVALMALRFAWGWLSMRLTLFNLARRGEPSPPPPLRLVALFATAGVRGAITLAGVLTLPLVMPDGAQFPARNVAIVIAMGVILASLLIASVGLPWLARGLKLDLPPANPADDEGAARRAAAEAGVARIKALLAEPPPADPEAAAARTEAADFLLDIYRRRLGLADAAGNGAHDVQRLANAARDLRLLSLRAERDELYRLRRHRTITDEVHARLVRELDLMEASLLRPTTH